MLCTRVVILLLCVGQSLQYTEEQLRSLLSYDCSEDGSIDVRGVPDEYALSVISTYCTVYLTAPGEYNIPSTCKTYNYYGYDHGYMTTDRYQSTYWYGSSTSMPYFGEVDISISHGSHSGIVGGKEHHEFRLICDSIHTGGQLYRVSGAVNVYSSFTHVPPPTLSYRHQKVRAGYYRYPSLRITDGGGHNINDAHTGQLTYLLLSSNDPRYVIRPENCSANNAYYYATNVKQIDLFDIRHSGCLLEPYLMEMFRPVGHGQSSVRAPVYAFHFPGVSHVTFVCDVRICTKSSYNCDLDVCKSKRSARDVIEEDGHERHQLSASIYVGRPTSGAANPFSSLVPANIVLLICICALFQL